MMEESQATGEAAANLMQKFIDTGCIKDEGNGQFTIAGPNGDQTFNAYPEQS